jgi:hypothetical protein
MVTGFVTPAAAPPLVESSPGLTATLVVRWGYLPGVTPPANATEWRDLSGYLALGDGSIELVRALRWNGAVEPSTPRPGQDAVVVSSDARVLRFSSHIGTGSDGILVRLRRPSIKPVVVAISVANTVRYHAFEHFLSMRIESGGWSIPYGQVQTDCSMLPTSACYLPTGTLEGSWTYATSPNTLVQSFTGNVVRGDGSTQPLSLQAGGDIHGPYAGLTGTWGTNAAPTRGYFGRDWQFANYRRAGIVVGQLGEATAPSEQELFIATYQGTATTGSEVFKPVACDVTGAVQRSPFHF